MSQTLRKRGTKKSSDPQTDFDDDDLNKLKAQEVSSSQKDSPLAYKITMVVVSLFAIYTRFTNIETPSKVVFDEVHFGKFASYYLERTYFFDLHPPMAKLLIAFVGWLVGYDGSFKFESINDDYIAYGVPYVAYRSLSALQGVLTIPIMFQTMKTLGYSVTACAFASLLVCFDNAHIIDSRLILLDAMLNFSVALTMMCYAKFSTFRLKPFTRGWWFWLMATGFALSLVISTKYVGLLTYVTIGIAVIHELWFWLDYKRGLSLYDFGKHFVARLYALIVFPFIIYLCWFYIHFTILTKSGPGDAFMSSDFQETLLESPMAKFSKTVNNYDILTIKHKDTEAFLHSHAFKYPLRYEDGRISSNTQQVTGIKDDVPENIINDVNNQWQIIPTRQELTADTAVYTNDVIRFRHVGTGGYLLSHDVASPLKATNEEFTIVFDEDADKKYNETLFRLRFATPGSSSNKNKKKLVKTRGVPMRIMHVDTVVAMWTHDDELLPEWAFGQQEVSGNKKVQDKDNVWVFEDIVNMPDSDPRKKYVPKKVRPMPFLKKWWELQHLMFHHNNILSSSHPFASQPDSWPLSLSGVSFWNDNVNKKQIFFTGNVVGFWLQVCFLAIYVGLVLADQVTRRRDIHILNPQARSKLYNTLGFFFIGWCAHYLPFFLMNRQKFLHHYLPAHLIAALFSGGLVEFICSNNRPGVSYLYKWKINLLTVSCTVAIVWFFFYFRPLAYGDVYLTPQQIRDRQWLDIKLHYNK